MRPDPRTIVEQTLRANSTQNFAEMADAAVSALIEHAYVRPDPPSTSEVLAEIAERREVVEQALHDEQPRSRVAQLGVEIMGLVRTAEKQVSTKEEREALANHVRWLLIDVFGFDPSTAEQRAERADP